MSLQDAKLTLVETWDDAQDLLAWLGERRDFLGADIETTGLILGRDKTRLMQFGDGNHGWALDYADWRGLVKEVFKKYDRPIAFHNAIFDLSFLRWDGIVVPHHLVHDTMVMCHLLDSRRGIGLKPSAARYVDHAAWMGKDALSDAFRKGGWNFETIPTDHPAYWLYSAMDTVLTSLLADKLWPRVNPQYRRVYDVELGAIEVLVQARQHGVRLDLPYVHATRSRLVSELEQLLPQLPQGLNPNAEAQVRKFLLERGAVLVKRTEKGNLSVDDDVLKSLESRYPEAGVIRQYRSKYRMVSNYLDLFIGMNVDGILRASVKPLGARTSRMSITEPALQTLPRGPIIRDAVIPREGHKILLADYSGAEMRVLAGLSNDQGLIDAYRRDEDVHTWVASEVFGKPQDQIDPLTERAIAKNTGFALVYGAGEEQMAATSGVDVATVSAFMARHRELFPNVHQFMQEVIHTCYHRLHNEGDAYVITPALGRRLAVDKDKLYAGVNYLIQCSATSDLLKMKLCELDAAGLTKYFRLPIHDEVFLEVPDDEVDDVKAELYRVLPDDGRIFGCPMAIETDVVARWGDHYRDEGRLPV